MLVDIKNAIWDAFEHLYDAQDPSSLAFAEHVDTGLEDVKEPKTSSTFCLNECDSQHQYDQTTITAAFVQAPDQCYDNFVDEPTSPIPDRYEEVSLKDDEAGKSSSILHTDEYTSTPQENESKRASVQKAVDKIPVKPGIDSDNSSHIKIPKATYDALMELVSFYKHFSEHDKTRHEVVASLDATQRRLRILHADLSVVSERVEGSHLSTKSDMLEAINHHFEVVDTATELAKQQLNDFLDAEQRLAAARDVMTDSLARRLELDTAVPSRLSCLTRDLVVKESSLKSQEYTAINDEIHEMLQLVDEADAERLASEDMVSKMRSYQEERHALKEAKTLHARNGYGPKELDALLAAVEAREAELANEMQELSEDLAARGIRYTVQGESLDSMEEVDSQDTQAHLAEIDVRGVQKLDGHSELNSTKTSARQDSEDENEPSGRVITAERSASAPADEATARREILAVEECATPGVGDINDDENIDRACTSPLLEARRADEQADHKERTLRGNTPSRDSKPSEFQEQQDTEEQISTDYADILTDNNTADEKIDEKINEATQEEGAAVERQADGDGGSLDNDGVDLATGSDTSEGQQTGNWCHGDLAHVPSLDKDSKKQRCVDKEASEHADNPLLQKYEPEQQDDGEKALSQGPETALDTASFPLETNGSGQQAAGEEPLKVRTGIESSSNQMMDEAADHNLNLAPSETEDYLSKHGAITEVLPSPAMKEEPAPVEAMISSPEQRFNSGCGEMSFQPLYQEEGERLLPSEGVIKPFFTEVAEEHPRRQDFHEPLLSQDEIEQDSADVIDQSSEQRRNSEVGSPRAKSSTSAATNEPLPSKADIEQDPASVTEVSWTHNLNTPRPENIAAPASTSAELLSPNTSKIYHNASMQRLQMAVLEKRQQAVSHDKSSQFLEALDAYSQTLPLLRTLISRQDDTKEQNRCQGIYD